MMGNRRIEKEYKAITKTPFDRLRAGESRKARKKKQ
jgi:hypothetical protein